MLAAILTSMSLLGPPVQRPGDAPLTWSAPAECPAAQDVIARVHAFAPGVLVDSGRARVRATIELVEVGYRLEFVLHEDDDTIRRTLVGSSCEEVSDAVALLVAVLLDPVTSAREVQHRRSAAASPVPVNDASTRAPSEQPDRPDDPSDARPDDPSDARPDDRATSVTSTTSVELERPSVLEPDRPRPRSRARRELRAGLRIAGGGGYGPTTSGFGDLGGSAAVFGERWRAELGGAWTPSRELVREGIGGRFDAWRVSARGCFVPTLGARDRLELPLCPGVEFGQVRGRGLDSLPIALEASFPWVALGLGQGLWFAPLDRLAIGVDVQLAVPLRGGRFLIETIEIQRIAPLAVRGLVGVELRLP